MTANTDPNKPSTMLPPPDRGRSRCGCDRSSVIVRSPVNFVQSCRCHADSRSMSRDGASSDYANRTGFQKCPYVSGPRLPTYTLRRCQTHPNCLFPTRHYRRVRAKVLAGEELSHRRRRRALRQPRSSTASAGWRISSARNSTATTPTTTATATSITPTSAPLSCKFCSFYRKRGEEGAYEMPVEQVIATADKAADAGATEVHIVGGLHPWLKFDYYLDMLRGIRAALPAICTSKPSPPSRSSTSPASRR